MDIESPETKPSNTPEWSVSDLSGALKRTLEDAFGFVRVRGEISGYRGPVASGHVYFSLKDANAKIDAVIWKGVFGRLKTRPQEGLEVIATGKITTFAGKSSYQIVIDSLEPAGIGALMALLEERRRKLAAEGLFDEGRKQLIPFLPVTVGVITSPTGAVIRDILHRLEERFPRRVIVWPVRVQGETSAAEVANAIAGFNALPEGGRIPRPDVIIVARGGGSLEDLMGFNEEVVVRAAAASLIPLVSAVGHETDVTLIDHAADLRCPTPTGAAEKVVPVRSELLGQVTDLSRRLSGASLRLSERRRSDLRALARALPNPENLLAGPRQRLDLAAAKLGPALAKNARVHEQRLAQLDRRLHGQSPAARLATHAARLDGLGKRLAAARGAIFRAERDRIARAGDRLDSVAGRAQAAFARQVQRRRDRLESLWVLAASLGPQAVLARGYALVREESGALLRSAAAARPGLSLQITLADGSFGAVVPGGAAARQPARKPPSTGGQGDLF